jgi:2-polyprenyl-3-methyl-5-hydroxy-6-metoxy-1,4-benzoquinol methylase
MINKEGKQKIYQLHHKKGNRYGFTLYGEERSKFFSSFIGTGKKILDLGCRDGSLTRHYLSGNQVVGVDIDLEALELAEKKHKIKTIHLDINNKLGELGKDKYNIVVLSETLEHLYFPGDVLSEIYSLLGHGGVLLGSVPNAFRFPSRLRFLLGKKTGTSLWDPTHINHFSHEEIKNLLQGSGFKGIVLKPLVKKKYSCFEKIWPGSFSYLIMFKAEK